MLQEKLVNEEQMRIAEDRALLATFANVDFQRTRFWCLCASVAIDYPRRLGPDARPRELSYDKRVSRKVCHAYQVLWSLYSKETDAPPAPDWTDWPLHYIDPLMNRVGATLIWSRQIDYLIGVVNGRMQRLGELTELAGRDGLTRWLYKHDMLLEWELEALFRIQRFLEGERPGRQ